MKTKLKKVTKKQDVVFPHSFVRALQPRPLDPKPTEPSTLYKHRRLSKSKEKVVKEQQPKRSLSLQPRSTLKKTIPEQKVDLSFMNKKQSAEVKQIKRDQKYSKSSSEISSFFFKGMEKRLAEQCQQVLKLQKPQRPLSACKLKNLTPNLFFLQRKVEKPQASPFEFLDPLRTVWNSDQMQPISMMEVNTFPSIENQSDSNVAPDSVLEIRVLSDEEDEDILMQLEKSIIKRSMETKDKQSLYGRTSLLSSQTRYKKMCQSLNKTQVHMVSPKFVTNQGGYFTLKRIDTGQRNPTQIALSLQVSGKYLFKKLASLAGRKMTQSKLRKCHSRKVNHRRENSRQKLLGHFQNGGSNLQQLNLYEDILSYLENDMMLQNTYRGLVLVDIDQKQENISRTEAQTNIQARKQLYFMIRLSSTFYLVRAKHSTSQGLIFTFLCDFTTLSDGDQLTFPHIQPQPNGLEGRNKLNIIKSCEEFKEAVEKQWGGSLMKNQDFIAKIGKMGIHNIEKNEDEAISLEWKLNKQFQMVGEISNFFQLHNHFDCSLFSKGVRYFSSHPDIYALNSHYPIFLYRFPTYYDIIPVSQKLVESLAIAHLPPLSSNIQKKTMRAFFRRDNKRKEEKLRKQFSLVLKGRKVTSSIKNNRLQFLIESIATHKKDKLILPLNRQLRTSLFRVDSASEAVIKIIQSHQVKPSFLYSRYEVKDKSRVQIYYRGLQKMQNQYSFVTLYRLRAIAKIQLKIYLFKLGKQFIIPIDSSEIPPLSSKETVTNLINQLKKTYLKRYLQLQMRKSQQKRKQILQQFFKKQFKINPHNIRCKRKDIEENKKRSKMASMKGQVRQLNVYETITSKIWTTPTGQQCYLTIQYLPTPEVNAEKGQEKQQVLVCLHLSGKIFHFCFVTSIKSLAASATWQWKGLDQLDSLQMLFVFKGVTKSVQLLTSHSNNKLSSIISRLKHYLSLKFSDRYHTIHPLKYTLVGRELFQTQNPIKNFDRKDTQLSIDIAFSQNLSHASSHIIEQQSSLSSWNMPQSFGRGGRLQKGIQVTHLVEVGLSWVIEVVEPNSKVQYYRLQGRKKDLQIHLINRETQKHVILNPWEGDFVNTINYSQFNKRIFRRLLRGLRQAL